MATRSAGVSEVVGAGQDRPGGSAETGGGINDDIGDKVRGGVGRGAEWDRGRREGGVYGSEQVQWSGAERSGVEQSGAVRSGAVRSGAERSGAVRSGAERCGVKRSGAE